MTVEGALIASFNRHLDPVLPRLARLQHRFFAAEHALALGAGARLDAQHADTGRQIVPELQVRQRLRAHPNRTASIPPSDSAVSTSQPPSPGRQVLSDAIAASGVFSGPSSVLPPASTTVPSASAG